MDARPLGQRGVGRYLAGLLEGLHALKGDFSLTLFASPQSRLEFVPKDRRFQVEKVPAHPALAEQWVIPRRARALGLDLIHYPDNSGALWPGLPMVLTLHDGMWMRPLSQALHRPRLRQRLQDLYRKFVCPRAAEAASLVLTVSDFSRRELGRALELGGKLRVVPNALAASFLRPLHAAAVKRELKALGLSKPFIFCSGASDRRKNISALIRAFAAAKLKKMELVVTSLRPGEIETTDYRETAKASGVGPLVKFLGYLSEAQLKAMYQGARGFAFPSLWEGFGLPILEAYALGCPVLSSNAAALPEVAGQGAIYCDPKSTLR